MKTLLCIPLNRLDIAAHCMCLLSLDHGIFNKFLWALMTFQPSSHNNLYINSSSYPIQKQSTIIIRQTKGIKNFHYCCFHDLHSSKTIYLLCSLVCRMYSILAVVGREFSSKVGGDVETYRDATYRVQQMSAIHQLPHTTVRWSECRQTQCIDGTKKPFQIHLLMNRNGFANKI